MRCLVIAAGEGTRLAERGDTKPLIHLLGLSLIERVLMTGKKAGLTEFYIVTGYNGEEVRRFLDKLAVRRAIHITHILNEEWQKGNGLSVLKAKDHLDETFLLIMGDHLVDVELLKRIQDLSIGEDEVCLAIDRNTANPLVDLGDVTKVQVVEGKVADIGKDLAEYNAFDTGVFLCSPALFAALEKSMAERGDTSLSGGVRVLAEQRKVKTYSIQDAFWIDVDDPAALNRAEQSLLKQLRKPNDGPVSRYINRPVSVRISRYLVRTSVTPNQISVFCFLLSVVAAVLFAMGGYPALAAGALLAQIASIIDGCDGEVARLKFNESGYGGWFDAVLDRYGDAFMLFGLTWHVFVAGGDELTLFVGFMAIIGSFMNSYTADKYDGLMRSRLQSSRGIRIGRDIRVFMIFVGVLLNLPFWTLLAIALLTNLETVRRVIVCRDNE